LFERPKAGERAVLVNITFPRLEESSHIKEFKELTLAAGAEPVAHLLGSRKAPDPKYFMGKGKLEELKAIVAAEEADLVIFNHELSPAQERNVERELKCRVLSRTGLILDIFAQRARTFEGKLQVELAQLEHLSTRLVRGWTHLERQKGGIGLRGPGETQLETDRRLLRERIQFLKARLDKVRARRAQSRRARTRRSIPTVSLVGYTNAGKSTLFNALTGSDVFSANRLFATLDPTLRSLDLVGVGKVILADTVGFIRQLPHSLVDSFRATLEEVSQSSLLIHVVDANDEEQKEYIHQVNLVLSEIGADALPQIMVFNKSDLLSTEEKEAHEFEVKLGQYQNKVWVSSLTKEGFKELNSAIQAALSQEMTTGWIHLAANEGKIRALFYELHAVLQEQVRLDGGWDIEIKMTNKRWGQLCQKYISLAERLS